MAKDSDRSKATPPAAFGPARKYVRQGSSHHRHGWQEEPLAAAVGAHRAPRAPKGSIPRTPLAERLRQRVAEEGKG
jgi:hypothetical protein